MLHNKWSYYCVSTQLRLIIFLDFRLTLSFYVKYRRIGGA